MSDNDSKIKDMQEVTGLPKKQAEEILKRYNWNKEEAIEAFLAGAEDEEDDDDVNMETDRPAASVQSSASGAASGARRNMLDIWEEERKKKGDKDGQQFYVGGERTGEVVIGPDRGKKPNSDLVKQLFDAAKEHGAEAVAPDEEHGHSHKPSIKAFSGSGQRLGAAGEATSSSATRPTAPETSPHKPPRNYRLRMWENGFSIDDSELREYNNPENQRFLSAIMQGRIPEELLRSAGGGEVHVDLEDRREEEYTPPARPKVKAFQGEGHRLGSVVPAMTSDSTAAPVSAPQTSVPAAKQAEVTLDVDDGQPITTIQIRLADGSRLVTRANHTHTVAQIRDLIRRARPALQTPFVLMTMFPNKEITDDSQTLAAAGLLNAAIVQRVGK